MSITSELGKSEENIIKYEISGHMNKYEILENKIINPSFLWKKDMNLSESLKESTNMDTGGQLIQFISNSRRHFTSFLKAS